MAANTNPSVDWQSLFCSACGGILDGSHGDCGLPQGRFCTQCGKPRHDYVCYPDARLLEKHGLKASPQTTAIKPKTPLKPLW